MSLNHSIYGISGVARSGKDTFGLHLGDLLLDRLGQDSVIMSFAGSLKQDLDSFLVSKTGISAFTTDDEEKKIIRPMLVSYGMMMRTLDPEYWISKLRPMIDQANEIDKVVIITDVRFPNEIKFVQSYSSSLAIHISRSIEGREVPPANEEEELNDPLCRAVVDQALTWPTYGESEDLYKQFVIASLF